MDCVADVLVALERGEIDRSRALVLLAELEAAAKGARLERRGELALEWAEAS